MSTLSSTCEFKVISDVTVVYCSLREIVKRALLTSMSKRLEPVRETSSLFTAAVGALFQRNYINGYCYSKNSSSKLGIIIFSAVKPQFRVFVE